MLSFPIIWLCTMVAATTPRTSPATHPTVQPDDAIQQAIHYFAQAPPRDRVEQLTRALAVAQLAPRQYQQLAFNAGYYAAHTSSVPHEMQPARVFVQLQTLLEISDGVSISALFPSICGDDVQLKDFVIRDVLCARDVGNHLPEFQSVIAYLLAHADAPESKVIAAELYPRDLDETLLALARIYKAPTERYGALIWSSHLIANDRWLIKYGFAKQSDVDQAIGALRHLAGAPEWWVRLYCAEVVLMQNEFRDKTVLDQLASDANSQVKELVREAMIPSAHEIGATPAPTKVSAPAQEAEACAQFHAYVAAVRARKLEDVMKLVEPATEDCKPVLRARLEQVIAFEAMKMEMVAQMGPPKADDDAWDTPGGLPYDDMLKSLKGVAQDENTIGLLATNPRINVEGPVGWMVRRNGKWLVSSGVVMDLEPAGDHFIQPTAEQRDEKIRYCESLKESAQTVLKRLKAKEFKKPIDVVNALGDEIKRRT